MELLTLTLLRPIAAIILFVKKLCAQLRKVEIQKLDFSNGEVSITLKNTGPHEDSIKSIIVTGGSISDKKKSNTNYHIQGPNVLMPNERKIVKALASCHEQWFINIKITYTVSDGNNIRLRHPGTWPKDKINIIRMLIEMFLYKYFHNFYRKYI
jgi:hypothetical protein